MFKVEYFLNIGHFWPCLAIFMHFCVCFFYVSWIKKHLLNKALMFLGSLNTNLIVFLSKAKKFIDISHFLLYLPIFSEFRAFFSVLDVHKKYLVNRMTTFIVLGVAEYKFHSYFYLKWYTFEILAIFMRFFTVFSM